MLLNCWQVSASARRRLPLTTYIGCGLSIIGCLATVILYLVCRYVLRSYLPCLTFLVSRPTSILARSAYGMLAERDIYIYILRGV